MSQVEISDYHSRSTILISVHGFLHSSMKPVMKACVLSVCDGEPVGGGGLRTGSQLYCQLPLPSTMRLWDFPTFTQPEHQRTPVVSVPERASDQAPSTCEPQQQPRKGSDTF